MKKSKAKNGEVRNSEVRNSEVRESGARKSGARKSGARKSKTAPTMPRRRVSRASEAAAKPVRERVLSAAFAAFTECGYEGASTLDIATRANVSKRELYALFANKQAMLAACIAERAKRMRMPLELPAVRDRRTLAETLTAFGAAVLGEVSHPKVLAVYRLAIAEIDRAPAVAEALNTFGRRANHAALTELLTAAQSIGLIGAAEPSAMAKQYFALLWGDLLVQLLLRTIEPLGVPDMQRRASAATEALLALHPA
jgi:AcrR family transcriptional regulator